MGIAKTKTLVQLKASSTCRGPIFGPTCHWKKRRSGHERLAEGTKASACKLVMQKTTPRTSIFASSRKSQPQRTPGCDLYR